MAQVFHPSTNTIAKFTIQAAVFLLAALSWTCVSLVRSSYNTGQDIVRPQPVPFSHDHHVAGLGIDCRYCHSSVETAGFAGMPSTATCMGCHAIIWQGAAVLAPVRESLRTNTPIRWTRVNDLPDFVYFSHDIHVAKGVGCATCHGRVDRMKLMTQAAPLLMRWCLDCHQRPQDFVRPRSEVFNMAYEAEDQRAEGERLVREHRIRDAYVLSNCSVCHR
jgi:hypothetical protein